MGSSKAHTLSERRGRVQNVEHEPNPWQWGEAMGYPFPARLGYGAAPLSRDPLAVVRQSAHSIACPTGRFRRRCTVSRPLLGHQVAVITNLPDLLKERA